MMYELMGERGAGGMDHPDVLSMLLGIGESEDAPKGMTDEQGRDEILTLFTAGHETTAVALLWTWYLLSENPGAEEKLHAELDTGPNGAAPLTPHLEPPPFTRRACSAASAL